MIAVFICSHLLIFHERDQQQEIFQMDENPFRRSPLPPLPPITQAEYLSFVPPPSPQEIRAEQMRYRQQKRKQLIQLGYNEEQIIFSDEDEDQYEDPSSSSLLESFSESESSCDHDIRNCGRKVECNYSQDRYSRSVSSYKQNCSNSKVISTPKQQMKHQSESQFQLDQQTQKLQLIYEYLQVSALTGRMIFSPKINKLLTTDSFVDSHSLAQIQQYIDSLRIPSAPSWQEEVNTRQARGEVQFVSEAAMWDLEQKILRLQKQQKQ